MMCAHGQKPEENKKKGRQLLGEASETRVVLSSLSGVPLMLLAHIYTRLYLLLIRFEKGICLTEKCLLFIYLF